MPTSRVVFPFGTNIAGSASRSARWRLGRDFSSASTQVREHTTNRASIRSRLRSLDHVRGIAGYRARRETPRIPRNMPAEMPTTLVRDLFPDFFLHRRRAGRAGARHGRLFDSNFLFCAVRRRLDQGGGEDLTEALAPNTRRVHSIRAPMDTGRSTPGEPCGVSGAGHGDACLAQRPPRTESDTTASSQRHTFQCSPPTSRYGRPLQAAEMIRSRCSREQGRPASRFRIMSRHARAW